MQVTLVVPIGTIEPAGGLQAVVTPGQLSDAVGVGNVSTRVVGNGHEEVATMLTVPEHAILGGSWSTTVTLNAQLDLLLEASVTEQAIVVVPFGNEEPLVGEQIGAPTPGQLSLTVGEA